MNAWLLVPKSTECYRDVNLTLYSGWLRNQSFRNQLYPLLTLVISLLDQSEILYTTFVFCFFQLPWSLHSTSVRVGDKLRKQEWGGEVEELIDVQVF